jgi:hypothetical protein
LRLRAVMHAANSKIFRCQHLHASVRNNQWTAHSIQFYYAIGVQHEERLRGSTL